MKMLKYSISLVQISFSILIPQDEVRSAIFLIQSFI